MTFSDMSDCHLPAESKQNSEALARSTELMTCARLPAAAPTAMPRMQ